MGFNEMLKFNLDSPLILLSNEEYDFDVTYTLFNLSDSCLVDTKQLRVAFKEPTCAKPLLSGSTC